MYGLLFFLGHFGVTGVEGECNKSEADVCVVFDLEAGVCRFEVVFVGQFGEMNLCHPEGIDFMRCSWPVGDPLVPKVVEAYSQIVISLIDGLHYQLNYINLTYHRLKSIFFLTISIF